MAVRAFELRDSRKLRLDGTTLRYIVHGTNSDSAARTQLLATAPTTLGSWIRKPTVTLSYEGNFLFTGEVDYGPVVLSDLPPTTNPTGASGGAGGASPPPPAPAEDDPLDSSVTFDIGSVTRRVYLSEETRHKLLKWPLNLTQSAPDFQKVVGVNGKTVEGYDRIEPKVELTVDREFEFVTVSYIDRIVDLVGSINQSDFPPLGKAEELLLLGVSGRLGGMSKDKSRPKLTYRFGRSKNRTNVQLVTGDSGNDIVAPSVKGWDHIWVLYEQDLGSQTITTQKALAAYVERIYPRRNFDNLGLYS